MITTSFIVSVYLTSLVFQLITIYLSIKLLTQAHIYRIPCLFLIFGFLFMTVRRIYPLIEIHQGGAPNVLDALTALLISALMMVGMHFMGKAFLSIEAQSSIYEHGSKVDGMTGALRKQETFVRLEQEISRSFRNKEPLALIMFDIDHFKYVNDRYGHLVGDLVLKNLVSHCQSILRDIDLLGRVGGEEFLVMLPNTNEAMAIEIAERLRVYVSQQTLAVVQNAPIKITISNGITIFNPNNEIDLIHSILADKYYKQADLAMYEAKKEGRNQSKVWKSG